MQTKLFENDGVAIFLCSSFSQTRIQNDWLLRFQISGALSGRGLYIAKTYSFSENDVVFNNEILLKLWQEHTNQRPQEYTNQRLFESTRDLSIPNGHASGKRGQNIWSSCNAAVHSINVATVRLKIYL